MFHTSVVGHMMSVSYTLLMVVVAVAAVALVVFCVIVAVALLVARCLFSAALSADD